MERMAESANTPLGTLDNAQMDVLWEQAKVAENR